MPTELNLGRWDRIQGAGGFLPNLDAPASLPAGNNAAVDIGRGRAGTHPNLILGICCMSLLVVGMDVTIVNVALPAIQKDLRATLAGLQWVIDAYTLVVASLLMLAGSMSDRFGRRRVFQIGLVVFMAGSLLCSMAHSMASLSLFVVFRHAFDQGPKAMIDQFEQLGDINSTFAKLAANAPAVKQAEAKLEAAQRDLAQAELDLRYCDIVAEIDGVVTRRNVDPGNMFRSAKT